MNVAFPRNTLLIVIGICCHFSLRAGHSFTNFPGPTGYIEGSHLSPAVKAMATAGLLPPSELVGIYYETNALAEILNSGRASGQSAFWKATFKGDSISVEAAKESFAELCRNAKREAGTPIDASNHDVKSMWSYYESAAAKLKTNTAVKVQGMVPLGIIAESSKIFAFSSLTNFRLTNSEEGWTMEMPSVFVSAFLRIGTSRVDIGLVYPFKDAKSIETAHTKFLEWLGQIDLQYRLSDK